MLKLITALAALGILYSAVEVRAQDTWQGREAAERRAYLIERYGVDEAARIEYEMWRHNRKMERIESEREWREWEAAQDRRNREQFPEVEIKPFKGAFKDYD